MSTNLRSTPVMNKKSVYQQKLAIALVLAAQLIFIPTQGIAGPPIPLEEPVFMRLARWALASDKSFASKIALFETHEGEEWVAKILGSNAHTIEKSKLPNALVAELKKKGDVKTAKLLEKRLNSVEQQFKDQFLTNNTKPLMQTLDPVNERYSGNASISSASADTGSLAQLLKPNMSQIFSKDLPTGPSLSDHLTFEGVPHLIKASVADSPLELTGFEDTTGNLWLPRSDGKPGFDVVSKPATGESMITVINSAGIIESSKIATVATDSKLLMPPLLDSSGQRIFSHLLKANKKYVYVSSTGNTELDRLLVNLFSVVKPTPLADSGYKLFELSQKFVEINKVRFDRTDEARAYQDLIDTSLSWSNYNTESSIFREAVKLAEKSGVSVSVPMIGSEPPPGVEIASLRIHSDSVPVGKTALIVDVGFESPTGIHRKATVALSDGPVAENFSTSGNAEFGAPVSSLRAIAESVLRDGETLVHLEEQVSYSKVRAIEYLCKSKGFCRSLKIIQISLKKLEFETPAALAKMNLVLDPALIELFKSNLPLRKFVLESQIKMRATELSDSNISDLLQLKIPLERVHIANASDIATIALNEDTATRAKLLVEEYLKKIPNQRCASIISTVLAATLMVVSQADLTDSSRLLYGQITAKNGTDFEKNNVYFLASADRYTPKSGVLLMDHFTEVNHIPLNRLLTFSTNFEYLPENSLIYYLDDFSGSGTQIIRNKETVFGKVSKGTEVRAGLLFATTSAVRALNADGIETEVVHRVSTATDVLSKFTTEDKILATRIFDGSYAGGATALILPHMAPDNNSDLFATEIAARVIHPNAVKNNQASFALPAECLHK